MSQMAVILRARKIVARELGRDVEECGNDVDVLALGADSLDIVSIAMEMEKAFGIDVPDEDLVDLKTVGDFVHYAARKVGGLPASFAASPERTDSNGR